MWAFMKAGNKRYQESPFVMLLDLEHLPARVRPQFPMTNLYFSIFKEKHNHGTLSVPGVKKLLDKLKEHKAEGSDNLRAKLRKLRTKKYPML